MRMRDTIPILHGKIRVIKRIKRKDQCYANWVLNTYACAVHIADAEPDLFTKPYIQGQHVWSRHSKWSEGKGRGL